VICVEAASFDTREAFLREALRVLKPGGTLVSQTLLFRRFLNPAWVGCPSHAVADIPATGGIDAAGLRRSTSRMRRRPVSAARRNLVRWARRNAQAAARTTRSASAGSRSTSRCRMDRRLQDLPLVAAIKPGDGKLVTAD
jgi:hypothetical protein